MHHSFGVSFCLRQNRDLNKDYSVYATIRTGDSKPCSMCIKGKINRKDWDIRKGRPKLKNQDLASFGIYLESIKAKCLKIFQELELADGAITAENIKNIYLGKASLNYSLVCELIGDFKN